jgi:transposase
MRVAHHVVLEPDQQEALEARARARRAPAWSVERARIVLLAIAGLQDREIAARLKITPERSARWRNRFLDGEISALGMRRVRGERRRLRRQQFRTLCAQQRRRNLRMRLTGVRAGWRKPLASAKKACGASGASTV